MKRVIELRGIDRGSIDPASNDEVTFTIPDDITITINIVDDKGKHVRTVYYTEMQFPKGMPK